MKRSSISPGCLAWMVTLLILVVALAVSFSKTSGPLVAERAVVALAPPVASPTHVPVLSFYTRTLEISDPITGVPQWTSVSDDWVAYSTANQGCGHCMPYVTTLHLRNPASDRRIDIHGSVWDYSSSVGGETQGINPSIAFFGKYLVWTQPGPKPLPDYSYQAGDFACTVCYYDTGSGRGGSVSSLEGLLSTDNTQVVPLDVDINGNVLAFVGNYDTGTLWVGNITNSQTKQLPGQVNAQALHRGVLLAGGDAAWIEGQQLTAYAAGANRVVQVADQAGNLHGDHLHTILWYGQGGVQKALLDSATGQVSSQPLSRTAANFDVAFGSGVFGDLIAWADDVTDNSTTLHVAPLSGGPDLLTRTITTFNYGYGSGIAPGLLSLGTDRLLYVTNDGSAYPQFNFLLAWLRLPDPAFATVWDKADGQVASGQAARSWLWGPQPNYLGLEAYQEGPGGTRLVEYYDKSRMEVNNPAADPSGPYYVTNGLLVTEMIGGEIQIGDLTTIKASVPCTIPVAGDPLKDNPITPSYATLASVASIHGEHQATNRIGQSVNDSMDAEGVISVDTAHADIAHYAAYAAQTGHNIPDLFWSYLTGMQGVYGFDWTFVLGYPITEAYWTRMRVSGQDYPVLIQAYQRRVLTYTPDFPPEWRVQQGNVGQHYFEWRYVLNNR